MAHYAYIRVSTKEQNIDRQLVALEPFQIPKRNIFCDYQSRKDFDRPAYKKLLKRLSSGDLLIVKSIDRPGRNYNDILVQWQYITKEVHADIKVLDTPLLDTRAKDGDLTGTLIADTDRRHCSASPCLCSSDGEGLHPTETGGRDCGGKSERSAIWETANGYSIGIS